MADPKDSLASFRRISADYAGLSFKFDLVGKLHGKSLTLPRSKSDDTLSFSVQGQEILEAIVNRVHDIRQLIREVRSFRTDSSMVLTAAAQNKKGVRFAVEFEIIDPKQLRNSKNLELFLLKHNNVEIRSISVQAAFNFDSLDDTVSTTAVFAKSNKKL